jgi:hypothetical protein
MRLGVVVGMVGLLAAAPAASAQDFEFGSNRPDTSTGIEVEVDNGDFINPVTGGQGPSLEAFTVTLPAGTGLNDDFIPNCTLSLQQLQTNPAGANRCPGSSRIGEMELQLTAPGTPNIEAEFDLYNTAGGFVGTFTQGGSQTFNVIQGTFRGGTSPRVNVNSIPGPPPPNAEGVQAVYSYARVELSPAARGRLDFIVTPSSCPPARGPVRANWPAQFSVLAAGGRKATEEDETFLCVNYPSRD